MSVFQILILFQELDNLNKPFVLRFSILLLTLILNFSLEKPFHRIKIHKLTVFLTLK